MWLPLLLLQQQLLLLLLQHYRLLLGPQLQLQMFVGQQLAPLALYVHLIEARASLVGRPGV